MTTFNILVAYTTDCVDWQQQELLPIETMSKEDLHSNIYESIDEMNGAFRNSSIDLEGKIVAIEAINTYVVNGQSVPMACDQYKQELLQGSQFQQVFELRAKHKADVIMLVIGDHSTVGDPCGGALPATKKNEAFVVIPHRKLLTEYIPAHEIAHLFGAKHEQGSDLHTQDDGDTAHGHFTQEWRTIMCYELKWKTKVIQYFSNPNVSFKGEPTGTTKANNAARILENAPTIIGLRD